MNVWTATNSFDMAICGFQMVLSSSVWDCLNIMYSPSEDWNICPHVPRENRSMIHFGERFDSHISRSIQMRSFREGFRELRKAVFKTPVG